MIERERRFLLGQRPADLNQRNYHTIRQGYFSRNDPRASADPLRIRHEQTVRADQIASELYALTKKHQLTPDQRGVSREETISLSADEFALLWPLAPHRIEKTRFFYPLADSLIAEIDQFGGRLAGYQIVEVEFPDEAAYANFQPPAWFDREITPQDWACNAIYAQLDRSQLDRLLAGASLDEILPQPTANGSSQ